MFKHTAAATFLTLLVGGLVALRLASPARADMSTASATLLASLGMSADGIPEPAELYSDSYEFVFQYDEDVDAMEIAAQWTAALFNNGYDRMNDLSVDDGRYVLEYRKDAAKFVIAVGPTPDGPVVDFASVEEYTDHWSVSDDVAPPLEVADVW